MELYTYEFNSMGCQCSMEIYANDQDEAERVFKACFQESHRLDKYYSNYSATSFASQINRSAGDTAGIIVDEETAKLLDYADLCFDLSDGLFDLTSGILYRAWDFWAPQPTLPSEETLNNLLKFVGWDKVIWKRPKLILPQQGMYLDFGGIVKEYAADCLASLAQQMGIRHGIVNMSGDIKVIGPHYDGSPWAIKIKKPPSQKSHSTKNSDPMTVYLKQGALATSGDYEKCIVINNKRYSHILNPKTGWPCQGLSSATVVTDLCIVAGSLTTSVLLKGKENGIKWLKSVGAIFYCYDDDGKLIKS